MKTLRLLCLALFCFLGTAQSALAESTTVDLFRWGNASSPRLDNIRPTDLATYKHNGQDWVEAKSGGISTTSVDDGGKNTWKLPKGSAYPSKLYIVNDHDNHWSIQPAINMPMTEYQSLLRELGARFIKLPR